MKSRDMSIDGVHITMMIYFLPLADCHAYAHDITSSASLSGRIDTTVSSLFLHTFAARRKISNLFKDAIYFSIDT